MTNRNRLGAVLALLGAVIWALAGSGQMMKLTRWDLPTPNALPNGIVVAPDGLVYFTEFGLGRVAQLDRTTNEIRERNVGAGPLALVMDHEGSLVFTLGLDNTLELLVFVGGGASWSIPSPDCWPGDLAAAATGPGTINLWLTERNTSKVARFSPAQIAVTLPYIITPPTPVAPIETEITPVVTAVTPDAYPGNPMLPPPIALLIPATNGPFTEWQALIADAYMERLAVGPDGRVWFTQGPVPICVLDPETNTALVYGIPPGTSALGITADGGGRVWFTDMGRDSIGVLDPATADVQLWRIPGGVQPFDLAVDDSGNIWFTDREGDTVGRLDPVQNEFAVYSLPSGCHPLFFTFDLLGDIVFTTERGNFIGYLWKPYALGEPPVFPGGGSPSGGGFTFLGYSISQMGSRATASVTYRYDGALGPDMWVGAEVLLAGSALPGFVVHSVRVPQIGVGTVDLAIEYQGTAAVQSDQIRLTAGLVTLPVPVAVELVDFATAWSR